MIEVRDYFAKHRFSHEDEITDEILEAAAVTVQRANKLIEVFGDFWGINSGWRPVDVNARTPGAAKFSKHTTGQAIDLADPEGMLDDWCMENLDMLESMELWLEHPSATKGWCHVQTVPPKSGKRVFYP